VIKFSERIVMGSKLDPENKRGEQSNQIDIQ